MHRKANLMEGVSPSQLGLEVAPWCAPLAARRDGWNVRILDVFDTQTLRDRGSADPNLTSFDMTDIEEVDYVGSATEIAALVPEALHGQFDYIVSSHNFEHLANPIKFLNGCERLLRPGGVLTMAIPDKRGCFDLFRPLTEVADWIEAWMEDRDRPTPRQVFAGRGSAAVHVSTVGGPNEIAFPVRARPDPMTVIGDLRAEFEAWRSGAHGDSYQDAHCTVMTPSSLRLVLMEARQLGLIGLEVSWVREDGDYEFYIRLRKPAWEGATGSLDDTDLQRERGRLMAAVLAELSVKPVPARQKAWSRRVSRAVRRFGRRLRGKPDR